MPRSPFDEPPPQERAAVSRTLLDGAHVLVSAERLLGFAFWSTRLSANGQTVSSSGVDGNVLAGVSGPATPHGIPRLAFDAIPFGGLTLGGSFGYMTHSGTETLPNKSEQPIASLRVLTFAPRVGYAIDFSKHVGLWLRGGITYYRIDGSSTQTDTTGNVTAIDSTRQGVSLDLEPTLMLSPAAHFAFTFGLVADLPLGGSYSESGQLSGVPFDLTYTSFGLQSGLTAWF